MITYYYGDDDYELVNNLKLFKQNYDSRVVILDSENSIEQIQTHLLSLSLLDDSRLVVLKNVSKNSNIWVALLDMVEKIAEGVVLLVLEAKPDKRSATHKKLVKIANSKEFLIPRAQLNSINVDWVKNLMKQKNVKLAESQVKEMILKTNFNKWLINETLDKIWLSQQSGITVDVDDLFVAEVQANVFLLFESSFRLDQVELKSLIESTARTEDPFKTLGLLSAQFFNLVAVFVSYQPILKTAQDLGISPYALSKLQPYTKRLSKSKIRMICKIIADTDSAIKSTSINPWILITQMLLKINRTLI